MLLLIGQLCDNNCTVHFNKDPYTIVHNDTKILQGKQNNQDILGASPLTKSIQTKVTNDQCHIKNPQIVSKGKTYQKRH